MEINKRNRTELKSFFEAHDIPTQQQFEQLIDAGVNQAEDSIIKVQGSPIALQAEGEAVGTQEILNLFADFANDTPDWSLNLNSRVDPQQPDSNQPGLNIKDATGQSRLFIRSGNGSIGMGTITSGSRLTVQGTESNSLIAAIAATEERSRIFEVTREDDNGMLSIRDGDATLVTCLSGAVETPGFFLGNVGIGTTNPKAPLQVSGENAMLKITNTGTDPGTEARLGFYHSAATDKSWELVVRQDPGDMEFIPVANVNKAIIMKNDGSIAVPGGVSVGEGNRGDHINVAGALYRQNGQAYLTIKDNFYIRDKDNGPKMHFNTNNGRMAIGGINPAAPLSISGTGKDENPDASMHITESSILFGGSNNGRHSNSAKISAGTPSANILHIYGMSSGTSSKDRKVEIFAEGGLLINGHTQTQSDYEVVFSASLATNMTGAKNPLKFEQVNYNPGNHFINNDHFIAPVTGLYLFTMCMRHNTSSGDVGWRLRLNDTGYVNGLSGNEPDERSMLIAKTALHMNSRTVITMLNAGDKVHVEQFGSGGNDNHASGFEGVLLEACF